MCEWAVFVTVCVLHARLKATLELSSPFSNCISSSFRYDQLCLEPDLPLSPGSPSPSRAARLSEKEPEREREQPWPPALAPETMATRLTVTAGDRNRHKHRNRPFCHWDRPAEAWESGGGTVSGSLRLSRLFLICPNMTKKWCTCWLYAVISQWSLRETLRAPQSRRE